MSWWEVKKARDHGGLIFGRSRKVGDKFEAPDRAMAFDEGEGLVERCADPNAKPPAKVAKPAAGEQAA